MASKSILTFSWIIFEVEEFELFDPEPGNNHFFLFFSLCSVGPFLILKMGGSSFILVVDYARAWSRKEKSHWLHTNVIDDRLAEPVVNINVMMSRISKRIQRNACAQVPL